MNSRAVPAIGAARHPHPQSAEEQVPLIFGDIQNHPINAESEGISTSPPPISISTY